MSQSQLLLQNQRKMKIISVIILLLSFLGCKTKSDFENSFSDTDVTATVSEYELASLDTVLVAAPNSTFIGYWFFTDKSLLFIDRIQSKIFQFDLNGNFKNSFLGKGDGPDRQNGIYGISSRDEGLIILSDNHISVFDSTFNLVRRLNLDLAGKETYEEMLHFPRADMFGLYEITWIGQNVNTPFLDLEGHGFILPLSMTHPELNGYWTKEYYESVAIMGFFDEKYKLQKLGGKRSEEYLKHNFLPNFDYLHITPKNNSILVSFPIDPKIHVYDQNLNFVSTFGVVGKGMKTDYVPTTTLEEAENQWEMDLGQFGYYDHIYFDQKEDLLFRSYLPQGRNSGSSRLQIYRDHQLVSDLEAPNRFRVLGSLDGLFYADGIVDEDNEILAFFKFRLDAK